MKKITYTIGFAFALLATSNAIAQQGFGTNQPSKSAAVEIKSTNKGLLIPRVNLIATDNASPINSTEIAHSLLVYNIGENPEENLKPGYYFWTATNSIKGAGRWVSLMDNTNFTVTNVLQGNSLVTTVNGVSSSPLDLNLTLLGDVTGTINNTKVVAIQGTEVSSTAPTTTNNFLKFDGTQWTPSNLTGSDITDKQAITTDGIIAVGSAINPTTDVLEGAVFTPTFLKIKDESITTTQIKNGTIVNADISDNAINSSKIENATILPEDIKSGGNSKVLVTNTDGSVAWIDQSSLGNKDSFAGTLPIKVDKSTVVNATGGHDYTISVATASATTLGVVKEKEVTPTVDIAENGELSVNTTNVQLNGDVTGPLNDTNISKLQGVEVVTANTNGTTNVVNNDLLQVVDGKWVNKSATDVIKDGIVVKNGLTSTIENNKNQIVLGGDLTQNTTISTKEFNLAITDLNPVSTVVPTTKVMISGENGVLETTTVSEIVAQGAKTLRYSIDVDTDIQDLTDYDSNAKEVFVDVTLKDSNDIDLSFPAAASAKGQVINVRIMNTSETYTTGDVTNNFGFLNILDTYGQMPKQGWVVKSNGSEWVIVSRN